MIGRIGGGHSRCSLFSSNLIMPTAMKLEYLSKWQQWAPEASLARPT